MSFTRLASSVALTCAVFAVALPGCSSDQPEPGVGNLDMAVTLATPPAGPNEQVDAVEVSFYCEGTDPVLGVPRPPVGSPETFTVNTSTSEGPEPYNTIGLFEKQGLPAGDCHFEFSAFSNTGNTECTGEAKVTVVRNMTTSFEVVLACIHTPRYGGVRADGTFNQCAEYRQILVSPTTQSIGNLVDVRTEVYDPDGDDVTVKVTTEGVCGNVATIGSDTEASCGLDDCEAVVNTVECTGVGLCEITVAVSDDNFGSCTGFLPDENESNNDAARQTIAVDCTVAQGCGNGQIDLGEECEPPNTAFCDEFCQKIFVCPPEAPNPCEATSNECNPQTCDPDENNNPVCSDNFQTGACDLGGGETGSCVNGQCVACVNDPDCDDGNDCTNDRCDAGTCVNEADDANTCTDGNLCTNDACVSGDCVSTPVTCDESGIECQTNVCDPADGECKLTDDGIDTGCDLTGPGTGVCDGVGMCVECTMDSQCDTGAGETCVNNVCEAPPAPACLYAQDFNRLDPEDKDALGRDGWLYFGNVFDSGGGFKFGFGPFDAPTTSGQISGIAVGEGGPDQNPNQLVVFSNYDCCQPGEGHFGTDLVETIVFQEPFPNATGGIPGSEIGNVYTFQFDAKRGNIEGSTTAQAFIRTLDPGAGFATIQNITLDTTSLPTTWGTYSIQIDLSDPDNQGKVLQFGFSTIAQGFEGAGNFYDNVTFGPEGCSGDGSVCVDPALPNLTINGDFETGDTCGWEFFTNDGTFAVTGAQFNGGAFSGKLVANVPADGGPTSFPLIKQANIGIGTVQPNSQVTIRFDLFGSLTGPGGVVFAEFFSELAGGGTSSTEILGGGPLFPNAPNDWTADWVSYEFTATTGPDVSGGVTLQLKNDCGANAGCNVTTYWDNVSVTTP